MSRLKKHTSLAPPYLKRVWLDEEKVPARTAYHFCLPLFCAPGFELGFDRAITIIIGERMGPATRWLIGLGVDCG